MSHDSIDEYRDDDDDDDDDINVSKPSMSVSDISDSSSVPDDDYEIMGKRKKKPDFKKPAEKPKKRLKMNRFVEEEAEEASEEEDDVINQNYYQQIDDDLKKQRPELQDKAFDRQFNMMMQRRQQSHDVIQKIEERYKDLPEGEAQEFYEADGLESNEMDIEAPKTDEPKVIYINTKKEKIWRVSCNRGKEMDSTFSLMFKYEKTLGSETHQKMDIVSAFSLKKFPGVIFVEAYFKWQVEKAVDGIYNLRHTGIEMLQEQQCIALFTPIEQEAVPVEAGQWVRVRNHAIYNGDLARVLEVNETRRTCVLKVVARERRELTSFTHEKPSQKSEKKPDTSGNGFKAEFDDEDENINQQKPSKWAFRMKHLIEQKRYVRGPKIPIKQEKQYSSLRDDQSHFYYQDLGLERQRCKSDGFALIHINATNLLLNNINPRLDELAYFYPDVKNLPAFLPRLQKSLKTAVVQKNAFKIGDKVQLQSGIVKFTVKYILPDGKLMLQHSTKDKTTGEVKLYEHIQDPSQLSIAYSKYQQINVINGPNSGIQGIILEIKNNSATISTDNNRVLQCQLSDLQPQQRIQGLDQSINADPFKVSSQTTTEVNQSKDKSGITRYDLIRFGAVDTDVGCVLSIENNEINVLDLTNKVRNINFMDVIAKLQTRNNVAKNMHRNEIKQGDLVVVLDGFYKDCRATVIHVYRDFLFLHSGKFDNTQGIIVEKVNICALISSASSGKQRVRQRPNNTDANGVTGQDELQKMVGQYITVSRGQWAGYRGMLQNVAPKTVTVQLTAKNLTVKVLREDVLQGEPQHNQNGVQAGKTPHYAPHHVQKSWGEETDAQKQAYMSPYVYNTPMHDYQ